ncbi:MAG TPA: hypothetical protein VNN22_15925 [Verrucomicrobiae bacterium]|nr:hypothetical protein [Verrucomicrobiae bacterium]
MLAHILVLAIEFLIHGALLLLLLWIMIKVQSLNCNFLGLLGSAALGSGLDMIPYFGHALAVPVLYFCIWKVTQASLFPDAAFTVVIAYALMFAVNMFLLGALMGDLRPHDKMIVGDPNYSQAADDEPKAAAETAKPATVTAGKTAAVAPVDKIIKEFSVKGVTRNADKSAVTLLSGTKAYTLFLGQLVSVQTTDGLVSVRFTELGTNYVVLSIRGAQVKYPVRSQ